VLCYKPDDNRKGNLTRITACDCPADLANESYITVEPSLRFALFKSNFLFIWWSTFGFQLDKSFTYQLGINPAYPDQKLPCSVKVILIKSKNNYFNANWSRYDIPLSTDATKHNLYCLLLFLSNLILVKITFNKHGTTLL
jgi:hypothetical protein